MVWAYGLGWIMSNRINHAQLSLTIVSPTNIGGPEKLTTKDYMYNYDAGEVYLLNNYEWFRFLARHNKLAEFEAYMQDEMVRPNGRTMYDWAKNAIGASQLTKDTLGSAIGSIMKSSIYNKGRKNSLNDITPQIRGANGDVYIPGSSIKGVIDSAIVSHILRRDARFRATVQQKLKEILQKYRDFQYDKKRCKREIGSVLREVNKLIDRNIQVLFGNSEKRVNGILASAFRGVSVSDAMPMGVIKTEVLKKEDSCVEEDGTHDISVHRECILPNQQFSFTLTLDTAMTKEIGITSIDQVLDILQEDFDTTHKLLASKFKKVSPSVFKALDSANAYIGSNTGFIQKTIIMAAFTDDEKTGIDIIRAILDVNFQKAKHDSKDKFMAIELGITADPSIKIVQSIGSVLHGVLMELVGIEYAGQLHETGLRPYSQYIYFDKEKGQYIWRLSAVTAEAVERILRPALDMPEKIFLKQKRGHIYIQDRTILEETSYEALMAKFWSGEAEYAQAKLRCVTTTSFKVDQQYTIFPEAFRIYRYLLRQWNQFTTFEMMDSEDLLAALESAAFIRDYNLRMSMYGLEGVKIRGFRGEIVMQFKRNLVMQRILSLLTYYSQFTGLGIKTALGMGGVQSEVVQ